MPLTFSAHASRAALEREPDRRRGGLRERPEVVRSRCRRRGSSGRRGRRSSGPRGQLGRRSSRRRAPSPRGAPVARVYQRDAQAERRALERREQCGVSAIASGVPCGVTLRDRVRRCRRRRPRSGSVGGRERAPALSPMLDGRHVGDDAVARRDRDRARVRGAVDQLRLPSGRPSGRRRRPRSSGCTARCPRGSRPRPRSRRT